MEHRHIVNEGILDFLGGTDTCTVSNAIETFNVRMRNEGFVHNVIHSVIPELPPAVGYAATGRVRTTAPPIADLCYYHRIDWWRYVASIQGPKIVVIADVDHVPGAGAFMGEIHAHIAKGLGCVGCLTNGTVRELGALKASRFSCFASGVCVSHAYAHIVEFGQPVDIGGLTIATGDLLHGDRHGVQKIPVQIANELPAEVERIVRRESEMVRLCNSPEFSLEKLESALARDIALCQPRFPSRQENTVPGCPHDRMPVSRGL